MVMASVIVYRTMTCCYCVQARSLLDAKDVPYKVVYIDKEPAQFKKMLESYNGIANSLILEITESMPIKNIEQVSQTLADLGEFGVKIAIDDFGTSYSSLNYLRWLPIHILKVDQSFIRELGTNPNDVSVTRSIINLAHNLNLEIIAEGVETQTQMQILEKLDCHLMQGYLFSKPIPASDCLHIVIPNRS